MRQPKLPRPITLRLLVHVVVVSLVLPLLVMAGATAWGRWQVRTASTELTSVVMPATAATAGLTQGFLDEETGQRGYLLTGKQAFLEPYQSGSSDVTRWHAELVRLVSGDPETLGVLDDVMRAGQTWRIQAAEPQIALRQRGEPLPEAMLSATANGKQLFDALRTQLTALQSRMATLTADQLRLIADAQSLANTVTVVAVVLAAIVAAAAILIVQRSLTRPLQHLLVQVEAVASGQHDQRINVSGPGELATIARSVDAMREELITNSRELVSAQHELTLRAEQERMAEQLCDRSIRQISALGVELSSLAARNPRLEAELSKLVHFTDTIIRGLGDAIFGERDAIPTQRAEETELRAPTGEVHGGTLGSG
jgi:CHASE3 domain sensor protein